jgi:hypothetical protein
LHPLESVALSRRTPIAAIAHTQSRSRSQGKELLFAFRALEHSETAGSSRGDFSNGGGFASICLSERMARRATAASATVCRFATGHRCSPHRIKRPAGLPRVGYSARLTKPRNPIGRGPCGFHRGSCARPICRTPQKGELTSKNPAQCLSQLIVLAYET